MKRLFLILNLFVISFVNCFSQDTIKTNLRVKIIGNLEIAEKLNCRFIVSKKCDYILFQNIDQYIDFKIPLTAFKEEFALQKWKTYVYSADYKDIVHLNYENDIMYGIKTIDSHGNETLYLNVENINEYPKAIK